MPVLKPINGLPLPPRRNYALELRRLPTFGNVIVSPRRTVRQINRRAQGICALDVDDVARVEADCNAAVVSDRRNNVAQRRVVQVDNVRRRSVENIVRALQTSSDKNIRTVAADESISVKTGAAPKLTAAVAREDDVRACRRAVDNFVAGKPAPVDNARRRRLIRLDEIVVGGVAKVNNFIRGVLNCKRARRGADEEIARFVEGRARVRAESYRLSRVI